MSAALPQPPDGHVWEITEETDAVDRALKGRRFRLDLVQYEDVPARLETRRTWWGGRREVKVPGSTVRRVKAFDFIAAPSGPLPEDFVRSAHACLEVHARALTAAWFADAYKPRSIHA